MDPGCRVVRRVEAGAGEPVVVLEAGMNNGAASWQRVMPLLAPHVRVAAYDRAGIGGSAPAPGLPVIDRQLDDLTSVITELAAGPCVLAGHSWGGVLVQLLALRRPDLVAGLVLVDPGHEGMESGLPLAIQWGLRVTLAAFPDEVHDDAPRAAAAMRELGAGSARTGRPCRPGSPRPYRRDATSSTAPVTTSRGTGPPSWRTRSSRSPPRRGPAPTAALDLNLALSSIVSAMTFSDGGA